MASSLSLRGLTHRYRRGASPAVDDVTLDVRPGSLTTLLGPSGCGKSTVLKAVAGLISPTGGDIVVDDRSVLQVSPERRGTAMVFQQPLLFPHMTVSDNVAFGLRARGDNRRAADNAVRDLLDIVQLSDLRDRKPRELSGGQQQRVSLARTLATRPRVLLLDEPFSALDTHLRDDMRTLVSDLHREVGCTTVMVTHDQEEAVMMSDQVALMIDGAVQMADCPEAFFDRPTNRSVAQFFGAENFIDGRAGVGIVETPLGTMAVDAPIPGSHVTLTIRPEQVRLEAGENSFAATVIDVLYRGTRLTCHLDAAGTRLRVDLPAGADVRAGDTVTARMPASALWPVSS